MRLLVLAALLSGCVRSGIGETTSDGRIDGPRGDAPRVDAPRADVRRVDLGQPEATPPDVALPDAPAPDAAPPCVGKVDSDTLLLYTFSGSGAKVIDATGKHHGTLVGSVARGLGAPGCGQAVAFPKSSSSYLVVPDAPDWDLAQGSLDFSLRVDTPATSSLRGIVSRDADQIVKPGHLSIYHLPDGGIAVRLQRTTNKGATRCSAPVTFGAWHHVGVNWGLGGLELFVDGVAAQRTDSVKPGPISLQCGTSTEQGIEGNDNPWVLGTSSHQSSEGSATPTSFGFDGAIDSFRISKARRAFGKTP